MSVSVNKRYTEGVISGASGFVIRTAINFVTLPIMIASLGAELFGLLMLLTGLNEFFSVINMGFSQGLVQRISRFIALKEEPSIRRYISVGACLYGLFALLVSLIALPLSDALIGWFNIPLQLAELAKMGFIITLFQASLSFLEGHFTAILMAHCDYKPVNVSQNTFFSIANIAAAIQLLLGWGLLSILIFKLILSFVRFFYLAWSSHKVEPNTFRLSRFQWSDVKDLFNISSYALVKNASFILMVHVDRFLITRYCSLEALAVYVFVYRFLVLPLTFADQALKGIYPLFSQYMANNQFDEIRAKFLQATQIVSFLSFSMVVAYLFSFSGIYKIFSGGWLNYEQSWQLSWIAGVSIIGSAIRYPAINLLFATDSHRFVTLCELGAALLKTALSILLLPSFNLLGPAIANVVCLWILFAAFLIPKIVVRFQLSWYLIFTKTILTPVLLSLLLTVLLWPIAYLPLTNPYLQLATNGIIYSAICLLWVWLTFPNIFQKFIKKSMALLPNYGVFKHG
jgi:O-antigen/teichoic acid export membrane protein